MVYETSEKILHIGVYEEVKLSDMEHKLLICLSSGNITSYAEIRRYLKLNDNRYVAQVKDELLSKSRNYLHIKFVRGIGYRLEDEIWFK